MDLKIKEIAKLLNVSETTIRRWLAKEEIPAYRLHHQYRFNLIEIENWMMGCRLAKGKKPLPPKEEEGESSSSQTKSHKALLENVQKGGMQQFGLYRALHCGQVITSLDAQNKEDLINKTMEMVSQQLSLDRIVISELLLDRERLMPTALNKGIAVPHARDAFLKKPHDVIVILFPKEPIDWGALDGEPVHTLFFLFACNEKRHLHLLAKLAHLSRDGVALKLLQQKPEKRELLNYIRRWESKFSN